MPPRNEGTSVQNDLMQNTNVDPKALRDKLRMDILRNMIPKECFEKSLIKSLYYMFRDLGIIYALWKAYPIYVEGNWLITFIWWNLMGFFMWALFVVGHDCGHTVFSNYSLINAICGHICHAPLLVPFWPWAQSHHQHHSYHNHVKKDHSFPWFNKDEYDNETSFFVKNLLKSPIHPLVSYGFSYLFLGFWDGSHFNPFGKLFSNRTQRIQCAISSMSVAAFIYILLEHIVEYNYADLLIKYIVPYLIFNYWLVLVTYLQHHEPDSKTFDDSDYHFAIAAMETIDRKFCWGLDDLHHNITNGHVIHHLFFTKIPHYNLSKATDALRPYLESLGVYKSQMNPNFLWTFVTYNAKYGMFTHSKAGMDVSRLSKKVE